MTTIYYTKRFDSGLLKGLTANCSIPMPDDAETIQHYARKLHVGAKGRDVITKTRWTIVDASFQNYQR